MEPLKPSAKKAILAANPQAAPEEIEEYERLLSQRFVADPDLPMAPVPRTPSGRRRGAMPVPGSPEQRLTELHQKLFGGAQGPVRKRGVRDRKRRGVRDRDPESSAS